jgi:flagellar protein FliO/FliZ
MTSAAAEAAVSTSTATPVPTFAVPTAAPPEPVTGVGAMLEIVLALAFVLALILAIAWISRRLRIGSHADGLIRVIAEVSLGQKERAVLLQVDGRRLLVGVASGAVSLLHAADAPPDQSTAGSDAPSSLPSTPNFAMLLRRSLGRS